MAISHAQTILSWQDNLLSEDMPPEWMWPLSDELEGWFEDVKKRQEERYGSHGREPVEDAPGMAQNELTKGKRR
jgi:hypothetical protein